MKEKTEVLPDKAIEEKCSLEVLDTELVERDEEVLKKINGGIKHNYPVKGMNTDEAVKALGEPSETNKAVSRQNRVYQCYDEDGFYYENVLCLSLKKEYS